MIPDLPTRARRATVGTRGGIAREEGRGMRALETIGFSLVVIIFTVGLLLFLMGGPSYRRKD